MRTRTVDNLLSIFFIALVLFFIFAFVMGVKSCHDAAQAKSKCRQKGGWVNERVDCYMDEICTSVPVGNDMYVDICNPTEVCDWRCEYGR